MTPAALAFGGTFLFCKINLVKLRVKATLHILWLLLIILPELFMTLLYSKVKTSTHLK